MIPEMTFNMTCQLCFVLRLSNPNIWR